jgi:hypothetical protein
MAKKQKLNKTSGKVVEKVDGDQVDAAESIFNKYTTPRVAIQ